MPTDEEIARAAMEASQQAFRNMSAQMARAWAQPRTNALDDLVAAMAKIEEAERKAAAEANRKLAERSAQAIEGMKLMGFVIDEASPLQGKPVGTHDSGVTFDLKLNNDGKLKAVRQDEPFYVNLTKQKRR